MSSGSRCHGSHMEFHIIDYIPDSIPELSLKPTNMDNIVNINDYDNLSYEPNILQPDTTSVQCLPSQKKNIQYDISIYHINTPKSRSPLPGHTQQKHHEWHHPVTDLNHIQQHISQPRIQSPVRKTVRNLVRKPINRDEQHAKHLENQKQKQNKKYFHSPIIRKLIITAEHLNVTRFNSDAEYVFNVIRNKSFDYYN